MWTPGGDREVTYRTCPKSHILEVKPRLEIGWLETCMYDHYVAWELWVHSGVEK